MKAEGLHPNAQRILQLAEAWNTGDVEEITSFFDDQLVYHLAGQNSVSGTYRGRDELARIAQQLRSMTDDTLKVEPLDILADDRNVVFLYRLYGERGTKSIDVTVANASEFGGDGKVKRVWFLADDQPAYDEFFG